MAGAASALFLLDIKGRVLIWRNYRGDVSVVEPERFFTKLIEKEGDPQSQDPVVYDNAIPVMVVFCIIALVSTFAFHDSHHRKLLVGSIGLVVSVAMYASPLVVMKKVIQTKSVEFMPLPLSICSFVASVLWLTYGLLIRDIFVAGPSVIGAPLGILQLVLHCKYWKRKVADVEEANKVDLDKGGDLVKAGSEMEDVEKGNIKKKITNDQSKS